MSTVVDVTASDGEEGDGRDPFGENAIEVDEETLRRLSPGAWVGRVTSRLDAVATRFIYGR